MISITIFMVKALYVTNSGLWEYVMMKLMHVIVTKVCNFLSKV